MFFNKSKVSKVVLLHKLEYIIMTRSLHQRMPPTKEVVKLIKKTIIVLT